MQMDFVQLSCLQQAAAGTALRRYRVSAASMMCMVWQQSRLCHLSVWAVDLSPRDSKACQHLRGSPDVHMRLTRVLPPCASQES
jgi:hypothetical protein